MSKMLLQKVILLSGRAERDMEAAHKKCTRGEERGQTSRIFCSKAKFPTNISEKEFCVEWGTH